MRPPNFAARAGRWSARHRRTAILGWLAFVVVAVLVGGALGTKHLSDADQGNGESQRGEKVLASQFKQPAGEQVIVQSSTATVDSARFRAAILDVERRLRAQRDVIALRSPLARGNDDQMSKDRRSALVAFQIRGPDDKASDRVAPILAATAAAQRAHPDLHIQQAGDASADKAFSQAFGDDFNRAKTLSLPITLIILLVAFGALVAAGIPVLLALSGVAATLGVVSIVSQIAPVDEAISEVVLLIGMAVGVDYSLFYMRREREERAAGRSKEAALEAAAATSGRAVLVSGFTVMAAMAGMYLTGDSTFSSFATGTIVVVGVAMIGSITVLPALLSKLGDGVMKGRVPLIAKRRERGGESRFWGAVLDRVLRRPRIAAVVAGGLLVALTVPAFGLHTAEPGVQGLPQNLAVTKAIDRIEAAFPGGSEPAGVVVQARDVRAPQVAAAIGQLRRRALANPEMGGPVTVDVNPDHTVADVRVPLAGSGTDARSVHALGTLRRELVPATVARVATVDVTGETAGSEDFNTQLKSRAPLVFLFVLAMAFVLLLATFRSVVIPLTAILLNLLSVGAAYGVLVLVFQHGWGKSLLGFHSTGAITSWVPLFLFVILFGLSMDYHVFIISRIREAYDGGMRTGDAVAHGIKSTAGVVTSAAMVMVSVFAVFAALGALEFKQMGVGLAAAVLIDATIVRAVLLPATMKLLGRWNWYLPRALGRVREPEGVRA